MGSQRSENGAITNYFRNVGWQPGMGMLDAYSAVNAGRVGRYDASDANDGGAAGTVRDKVEQQMDGHRAKAESLLSDYLGGGYVRASAPEDQPQVNALGAQMPQASDRMMPAFPQIGTQLDPASFQTAATNALAAPQFDTTAYLTRRLRDGA